MTTKPYTVNFTEKWEEKWGVAPLQAGLSVHGTITDSQGHTGALIIQQDGRIFRGNNGNLHALNQERALLAIKKARTKIRGKIVGQECPLCRKPWN